MVPDEGAKVGGMAIDNTDEQLENALSSMDARVALGSNVTTESDRHPEKQ
jgi:hypothetical protein